MELELQYTKHPLFFLREKMLVFECELQLFRLPEHLLTSRSIVLRNMYNIGKDVEVKEDEVEEGTEENPIPLGVKAKQFEAFCHYLLDPDKIQYGTPVTWKPDQLLNLYHAAKYFQYDAALNFARSRFSMCSGLDGLNKLVYGIVHNEERWIVHGLQEATIDGRIKLPSHGQNATFTKMGCSWITAIISHANDVYQTLLAELLDFPPQPDPQHPWQSELCTNHRACLDAIASSWKTLRKKVPTEKCPPAGSFCIMYFHQHLMCLAFSKMNSSCRAKFVEEVGERADLLYTKFIEATKECIIEIAEREVEAIQKEMEAARSRAQK